MNNVTIQPAAKQFWCNMLLKSTEQFKLRLFNFIFDSSVKYVLLEEPLTRASSNTQKSNIEYLKWMEITASQMTAVMQLKKTASMFWELLKSV